MKVQDWQAAPKVPFNLDGRIMYSESPVELVHLKLATGESLEMHKNPFDVIFYILKGEGILTVEEETRTFSGFVSIEVKATEMRAWKNNSDTDFEILVIKLLDK